jgi:DNA-directed RNA polymerase subunit K/omega
VELVASAEPNEMATDDVLQVRKIVLISPDRQVESVRRARQLSASVPELDPAASVAVGPLASITATEMRDELFPVTRRSISDY